MCTHAPEEGHRNFSATLEIAKDVKRPLAERQTACNRASRWGIVGSATPSNLDPEPSCRLISEGRTFANKLWLEELSPQAQRELARRAAEDASAAG